MKLDYIVEGDCVEVMKSFPSNSIDLTVTSPPYDDLRNYNGYSWNFTEVARELFRVTKDGGVVVWVVDDATIKGSETGTSFKQALYFKELGFNLHDTMIYMKNGSQYPEKVRYYKVFEYMFVFSKGKPKTINLLCDRENKWAGSWGKRSLRKKDGTLEQKEKVPYKQFGIRYNVWKINCGFGYTTKDKWAYTHPAMFPEKLAGDHILSWSNVGDVVLDPFVGSGTTAKMAKLNSRHYIGIDISKEYCSLANRRVNILDSK
jgi:DNA modification methylase